MNEERAAQVLGSLDQSQFTRRHASLYATVIAGHFFDGFDINMIGLVLPGIIATFQISVPQAGFLASSVFLGMLAGSVIIGMIADRIGRKRALLFAIGFYSATSLAAAFAESYPALAAIRMIEGFGLGAEVPLVFTYLSEYMPARRRGILLASSVFFWQVASFAAAMIAIIVVPSFTWRGMFVVGALPAIVLFVFVLRLPESARYLISQGRIDEAEAIARRLSTVAPSAVRAQILPAAAVGRLGDLMRAGYLRATLGIWIMQFTGGAVFVGLAVWLPSIFVKMGFPMVKSFAFTAAITGAGAVGNIAAGFLLDRIGRRATLAWFFLLGGVLMFAWGAATAPESIVVLGAMTSFFGGGGAGGPLFTYTSEIYPTRFRASGTGWAAGWQRIGGIVAPSVLGLLLASGAANYTFFAVMGATLLVGAFAAFFLGYETRGKSLEQITAALASTSKG